MFLFYVPHTQKRFNKSYKFLDAPPPHKNFQNSTLNGANTAHTAKVHIKIGQKVLKLSRIKRAWT
jgi:hypothetical protein